MFQNKCWDSIGQAYYNRKSGIAQPMICYDLHLPSTISQSMHCLQGEVQRGIPAWAFWKLFWGNRTHPYLHLLETRYIYLFLVALFNFLYPRWALPHCYKLQSISIEGKEVSVVHLSKNKLTYHFTYNNFPNLSFTFLLTLECNFTDLHLVLLRLHSVLFLLDCCTSPTVIRRLTYSAQLTWISRCCCWNENDTSLP